MLGPKKEGLNPWLGMGGPWRGESGCPAGGGSQGQGGGVGLMLGGLRGGEIGSAGCGLQGHQPGSVTGLPTGHPALIKVPADWLGCSGPLSLSFMS